MVHFKAGADPITVDEGWYKATLTKLEEREFADSAFPGLRVIWHFGLVNSNGKTMEDDRGFELDFWVFTSQSVGAKSNARPIIEALLDRSINRDDDGDTLAAAVEGKSCYVKIADYYDERGEPHGSRPVQGTWSSKRPPGVGGQHAASAPARGRPAPRQPENTDDIPF